MADKCDCNGPSDGSLLATVFDPVKLIDYQESAIVSRTILEKPTGTITVFAFDKGQALSEHTAPFDATVQLLDGQGQFTVDGQPHQLSAGEMLIMPANRPHSVSAVQRFKMMLTMIRS